MRHRVFACVGDVVLALPEPGVRSDGRLRRDAPQRLVARTDTVFARRLLLAALIGPAFTLTAQQPAGKPFDIASVDPSGITRRDRLRPGVWLGVLDEEDGITNGIGVPVGHVSLHLMQIGGTWVAYAGSGGAIHRARSAIERPSGPVDQLPTFSRGTGCWWLWLIFTGVRICR